MSTRTFTVNPIDEAFVRGAHHLERTATGILPHRLPTSAREQANDQQLSMVEAQPSGVRVVFRTTAGHIELDTVRSRTGYAGVPARPNGVIDLVVDGQLLASAETSGGNTTTINMSTGAADYEQGPVCSTVFSDLPAGEHVVELWLPHNETTELVELRMDAPAEPVDASRDPVWLHHGSSISHGSNAATPTGIWPAVASRIGGADLVNLGFGGSALIDQFTARAMRDTPADVISVKLGINLVNTDLMRLRAFRSAVHGFLDTVRDGHPTTPLLVVTPIYCGIHEHTPGPGAFDPEGLAVGQVRFIATGDPAEVAAGKLTLSSIRDELSQIVRERAATDPNLHLLDGLELYGEQDAAEHPLPDALHPDAETHRMIGERFANRVFGAGGAFALTTAHE